MLKRTKLLFWSLFYLSVVQIQAQNITLNQLKDTWQLDEYLELLADPMDTLQVEHLSTESVQAQFRSYLSQQESLEPHQTYWGKIQVKNNLPDAEKYAEWYFSISVNLSQIELFQQKSDGTYDRSFSGTFCPLSEKTFVTTNKGNIIKVLLPAHERQTFYFKVRSDRSSVQPEFKLKLEHSLAFMKAQSKEKRGVSFFMGFLMMMLLYNIMYFAFSKDKAYLYYSLYLLGVTVYTAYSIGDLALFLEPYLFPQRPEYIQLSKLIVYIGVMGYWAFLRSFFDLHLLLPRWDRLFKMLIWAGFPLMVIDVCLMVYSNFSPNVSDLATMGYILVFALVNLFFLKPLYQTKKKKAYFILAGVCIVAVSFLLTAIGRFESLNFSLSFYRVGTLFEIIAFSLGLAYRQKENESKQQQAKFELERNKILQEKEHAEAVRLKELDEIKTRLYTNITHEFRTPLTVIMGMADEIEGNSEAKKLIQRNSHNLLSLVNQILDLARLEAGEMQLNYVYKDISGYLQYLTEAFQSFAAAQNIRLISYTEVEELYMDFDEEKLKHLISNLLSNAVKFTPQNGKIILHLSQTLNENTGNDMLKIKIKDTGIGIPADKLAHIFDRFFQVETSDVRKKEGTGIGLALVKELVELMDGEINVKSEEGKGTVFTVLLPIRSSMASTTIQETGAKKMILGQIGEHDAAQLAAAWKKGDLRNDSPEKPVLLLAEDNVDVARYIEICLKEDYRVMTVENGQKGIDAAIEFIPDIIISDVMMPEKNGFELCRTLKKDERTSHIPIILLTAKATQEDKLEGLKSQADAYLMKPFDKEELLAQLNNMLNLRLLLQKKYGDLSVPSLVKKNETVESETLEETADLESAFLQKITQVIEKELTNPDLNVMKLGEVVFLSHTQVYRKIKALTGKTPSAFIRHIRLQKSLDLLKNSDMNITEIAFEVGYNDSNYFSRVFSKEFGITPTAMRNDQF